MEINFRINDCVGQWERFDVTKLRLSSHSAHSFLVRTRSGGDYINSKLNASLAISLFRGRTLAVYGSPTLENLISPCDGGEKGAWMSGLLFHVTFLCENCSSSCDTTLAGIFLAFSDDFPSNFSTQPLYLTITVMLIALCRNFVSYLFSLATQSSSTIAMLRQ